MRFAKTPQSFWSLHCCVSQWGSKTYFTDLFENSIYAFPLLRYSLLLLCFLWSYKSPWKVTFGEKLLREESENSFQTGNADECFLKLMFSRQKPICRMISSVKTHLDCWSWEAPLLLQLPNWGVYWWWPPAWPGFPLVWHCCDTGTASFSFLAESAHQPPLQIYSMKIREGLSSKIIIKTVVRLQVGGTNGILLPGHQFQWSLNRYWLKTSVLRHLTHSTSEFRHLVTSLVLLDGCLATEKAMLLHWGAVWCFLRRGKQESKDKPPPQNFYLPPLPFSHSHLCDFHF